MKKRKLSVKQLAALAKGRKARAQKLRFTKKKTTKIKTTFTKSKVKKVAKKRRRSTRKTKSSMFGNMSGIVGAVAYGAVREKLSTAVANSAIGQKLPVTEFTDEAVMLGINFAARKFGLGKNPIGNSLLRAQKTVELARIGQTVVDVMARKNAISQTSSNGMVVIS